MSAISACHQGACGILPVKNHGPNEHDEADQTSQGGSTQVAHCKK